MFEPVTSSVNLRDRVVQDILQKISSGDLSRGQRLPPEREMATQFNVSRTTIRDALRTLAALGVVSIEHGRGIFIRSGNGVALGQALWSPLIEGEHTISNLFDVRKSLETAAAGWAATRATEQERHDLMRIVISIRDAMMEAGDGELDVIAVADEEFHHAVLKASHNPVASRIMLNLLDVLGTARKQSLSIAGRAWRSVLEHEIIARAIVDGNIEEAQSRMLEHLAGVEREILRSLSNSQEGSN
ncbi:MAG: GntR family transcriptional regulator [Thermaerobacter sp.]|nr:GntR family transcriptional regulator [Thermaerobacter sp.]